MSLRLCIIVQRSRSPLWSGVRVRLGCCPCLSLLHPCFFCCCCRYDFEATTNQTRTLQPIEIIELSCVVVSTATAAITASYQSYVRPTEHPALNSFTSELTGIQQAQVDAAPLLADVLQHHHTWLQQQGVLADGVTCVPVTWTEWDLKVRVGWVPAPAAQQARLCLRLLAPPAARTRVSNSCAPAPASCPCLLHGFSACPTLA